ncbi:FtsX-like permease family protein [Curtobacterium sp. L1-20]|uniref:FtsX-like permease family protein n=1 Tax=Curtobacterium sp. L1-20 TaxID=3138181 RepID=UPI003B52023B
MSVHDTGHARQTPRPGRGGPWPGRLVRRSIADQAAALLALAVLVAVTTLAAVGTPRLVTSLLDADLNRTVASASPSFRDPAAGVSLAIDDTVSAPDHFFSQVWQALPDRLRSARAHTAPALRALLDDGHVSGQAVGLHSSPPLQGFIDEFAASGLRGGLTEHTGYRIDAYPGLRADSRLVQGHWPTPATTIGPDTVLEVVVTERTAREMHWRVGEEQQLAQDGGKVTARLVGLVAPRTTDSDFWALDPGRGRTFVTYDIYQTPLRHGIVFVDASTWPRIAPQLGGGDVAAWYHLDTTSISTATQPAISDGLDRLLAAPPTVTTPEGDVRVLRFSSFLPRLFGIAEQRAAASGELLAVSATGPLGVALVVVVLATSVVVARRRQDRALLRARGTGTGATVLRSAVETGLATVPAAVVGWLVAVAVLPHTSWSAGVAAGLVGVVVPPAVAAAVAVAEAVAVRGPRAAPYRWVVEALVVAGAAAAVVAVLRRAAGAAAGQTVGGDPLAVAAPLLVAAVAVVALLRLRPAVVRWTAALVRDRSAAAFVGTAEDARGGGAAAWVLGAVVLATGTGVVAAALLRAVGSATASTTGATKGLDRSVLVGGAATVVVGGLALAAVLTAVAVVITVVAAAPERRRRGGLLRTFGLSGRDRTAVTVWELIPRCVLGVIGGTVAGLLSAVVVVPAVVPGHGGVWPAPLRVVLTALGFGLAASVATVAAVLSDRRRPALVDDRSAA